MSSRLSAYSFLSCRGEEGGGVDLEMNVGAASGRVDKAERRLVGVGTREAAPSKHGGRDRTSQVVGAACAAHCASPPSCPQLSPHLPPLPSHLVPEAGALGGVPAVGHRVRRVHHVAVRRAGKLHAQAEHVHEVHHLAGAGWRGRGGWSEREWGRSQGAATVSRSSGSESGRLHRAAAIQRANHSPSAPCSCGTP